MLILRDQKGTALTNAELDSNFIQLEAGILDLDDRVTTIVDVTIPTQRAEIEAELTLKQPINSNLTSLSNLSTNGLISKTASGTIVTREIFAGSNNIVVTDGSSINGNPTIDIGSKVLLDDSTHVLSNKTISGVNNNIVAVSLVNSVVDVLPISKGGTNATTIEDARLNLGVAPLNSPNFTGIPTTPTPPTSSPSDRIVNAGWVAEHVTNRNYLTVGTAAATYAPLISPNLTGIPTAPTPISADSSQKIATTAFVKNIDAARASFDASMYAPLVSPSLSGTPTAPTPLTSDRSTKVATTEWVRSAMTSYNSVRGHITYNPASGQVIASRNLTVVRLGAGHYRIYLDPSIRSSTYTPLLGGSSWPRQAYYYNWWYWRYYYYYWNYYYNSQPGTIVITARTESYVDVSAGLFSYYWWANDYYWYYDNYGYYYDPYYGWTYGYYNQLIDPSVNIYLAIME